ncbi:ribulose-1,5-bisphosphate carboxylase/oxygenase large subunit [Striga asiatica]|uniref:Ribulose bisphosphate carboxylase large chain n=1 Tax=Striga asiatica TaxID=4170 RepID=A0A5A7QTW9_STRAF|nr:ribulose-1,5-bisphosphate carboxylase/oxygenase large subunit [Striga asiatica]
MLLLRREKREEEKKRYPPQAQSQLPSLSAVSHAREVHLRWPEDAPEPHPRRQPSAAGHVSSQIAYPPPWVWEAAAEMSDLARISVADHAGAARGGRCRAAEGFWASGDGRGRGAVARSGRLAGGSHPVEVVGEQRGVRRRQVAIGCLDMLRDRRFI